MGGTLDVDLEFFRRARWRNLKFDRQFTVPAEVVGKAIDWLRWLWITYKSDRPAVLETSAL